MLPSAYFHLSWNLAQKFLSNSVSSSSTLEHALFQTESAIDLLFHFQSSA